MASDKRLLSRGFAAPTTRGTLLMRIALSLIIVLSSVAAMLYVVALGIDQVYRLQVAHNIFYTPSSTSTPSARVLLLPQIDATVGLVTACVGDSCFSRTSRTGVQNLIANTLSSQTLPAGRATTLQQQLESEFLFGYDTARGCATNATKLRSVTGFGYAAYALSLFFFLGACVSSILFCLLVGDTDVLAGSPSLDRDSNAINVDSLGIPGAYLMLKLKRHLIHEVPLLISVLTSSGLSLAFSICGMGITIAVDLSSFKCGTSVCHSFETSVQSFFAELAAQNIAVTPTPTYSCRRGVALPLAVCGFILGVLCFLLSLLLFAWFSCAQRRREMLGLRDQLFRLAEVQGLLGTITGGDTPFPLGQSRQVSGVASAGSGAVSLGERDASGNMVAYRRGFSGGAGSRQPIAAFTAVESQSRHSRSVGARIELYRTMKQFMLTEDQARQRVVGQCDMELYSLLALREALWYGEELRLLHRFSLNWFVGPPLDLCVLETNARQQIIDEYICVVRDSLTSVAGGFATPEEPGQAWERSGPLPAADTTRWQQQVERWQHTAAVISPRLQQSASYERLEITSPLHHRTKSATLHATTTSLGLDTEHWLNILDRMRVSAQEEGGFLCQSGSPLLLSRRPTSAFANFDDNSSVSSNVFSNLSMIPLGSDDLLMPVDHLRPHLRRAAYVTKTPPLPPPRLRVLPQFQTKKQQAASAGKEGASAGRRRRSSSANNSSVSLTHDTPRGRSPSPGLRAPALSNHHLGNDNDSLSRTTANGANGDDHLYTAARPFRERDGTASGCSPFQSALVTHHASMAKVPGGRVRQSGAAEVKSASPPRDALPQDVEMSTTEAPSRPTTGNAWRFQRPAS